MNGRLKLAAVTVAIAVGWTVGVGHDGRAVASPEDESGVPTLYYAGGAAPVSMAPLVAPMVADASSTITVTYHDFPADAKAAFEYAASIWEMFLVSKAEILIDASWGTLPSDTLGWSTTRLFAKDGADDAALPLANVLYPAPLANALRGRRVDTKPDIQVIVNSAAGWYYGVDGRTPRNSYDLVTLALHEIGQQLGISSAFTLKDGVAASRTSSGRLTAFDQFVVSPTGQRLATLFARKDPALNVLLTNGPLFFDGPAAVVAGRGSPAQLYVPRTFDPGSSVGHLDANTYKYPNNNELMTPFLYRGWPTHDPGPVALAMLKDLGWEIALPGVTTRLLVEPTSSLVWDGKPFAIQPVVRTTDFVGALVTQDSATLVTVRFFSMFDTAEGGCTGPQTQTVSGGTATFSGCSMSGWGQAITVASSPGTFAGVGKPFLEVGDNRGFLPGLAVP